MLEEFYLQLSVIIGVVFFLSFLMHRMKQPLLIGYILTGIIVSPLVLNVISNPDDVDTFSKIGITFLLFIVGLKLNIKFIKDVGGPSLITGIGQIVFTTIIGTFIIRFLGYGFIDAFIIATALTFSSTVVIIKLLTDNKDLDKLHGKISLGFLLVQDLVAVFIFVLIAALAGVSEANDGEIGTDITTFFDILVNEVGNKLVLTIFVVLLLVYLSISFIPKVLDYIGNSIELLFVFVITWCLGLASLFHILVKSSEIGALIAGMTLASTHYQHEISSRMKPLRDFFIILFFIYIGLHMLPLCSETYNSANCIDLTTVKNDGVYAENPSILTEPLLFLENIKLDALFLWKKLILVWSSLQTIILDALILSLFVLVGNPLIVLILMLIMGYSTRVGLLSGLTVSQISEFSILLVLLASQNNLLQDERIVPIVTCVALITIFISTLLIKQGDRIVPLVHKITKRFERINAIEDFILFQVKKHDAILFGENRMGFGIMKILTKLKLKFLVVDYNPEIVKNLKQKKIACLYGDAGDAEFLSELKLPEIDLIISTIDNYETSSLLIQTYRNYNPKGIIIVSSHNIYNAKFLYEEGADYVILPHILGGIHISHLLKNIKKTKKALEKERTKQEKYIEDMLRFKKMKS